MATLEELERREALVRIDTLEPHELPLRTLYGIPEFIHWLDQTLPKFAHDPLYAILSPEEQVFALFNEYETGAGFSTDRRFKKLTTTPDHGVWELKTTDVRIFGWCPRKDCFICCYADKADDVKLFNKYGRYIAQTRLLIDTIELDEPRCIMSSRYSDVLST